MRRNRVSIVVCVVVVSSILPLTTIGDGNDPEITDNINDVFGRFQFLPPNMLAPIDIESAWFYEEQNEPEYLFTALKLKELEYRTIRAIYSIHWEYNGIEYASGIHTHTNGAYQVNFVSPRYTTDDITARFDETSDIITWKIPKSSIGNPTQGDILTKTYAWTAMRCRFEPLTLFCGSGELVKDAAPFLEAVEDYGNDYIIQY
jgi:hypothetical protein